MLSSLVKQKLALVSSRLLSIHSVLIQEEKQMYARVVKYVYLVFTLAFLSSIPLALTAQDASRSTDNSASKWDIFLGYSALIPNATIHGHGYDPIDYGAMASVTRYFNKNVGLQFEGDEHVLNPQGPNQTASEPGDDFSGASAGPIFRFPSARITPFLHALVGAERVGSYYQTDVWGPVVTLGGGLDVGTPAFHHHLSIRLFQADYQYVHENFPAAQGGSTSFNPQGRLSAGLVWNIGSFTPPPPVTLSCSASPASVFAGDPVTATATASSLVPKMNVIYSLTGPGLSATEATGTVATTTLAPSTYTVNCGVKEGRPGKEGLKPWESATGTATFTVKPFDPPTTGCSASPSSINPGETSTVTATGVSPQNRPLNYTYSATSGTVGGNGASATFSSAGAPTGSATITCTVADDKGQTATANTSVTVLAPPPPPAPPAEQVRLEARLALHSVFFPTAQPRVEHPDGGLVASQQGTLTTLATDFKSYLTFKPDAHLTLSGHADVRGSAEYNQALSERRVARTKQFLVEQGVSEASIDTRALGKDQELTTDQVKELVDQNTDLSVAEREKVLRDLSVIVLAQNRRVDVTLSTTGQQSVRLYPFNAADAITLLDKQSPKHKKKGTSSPK